MQKIPVTLLSLALLSGAAFGQGMRQSGPGVVNYVEGQASLDGRALRSNSAGSASLKNGEYVATANGKVEIVLTPGVFLRLGGDSMIQVVAADATHTEIRLEQGRADVEAFALPEGNNILIDMKGGQTHLLERGLYSFNEGASTVRVYEGKAAAYPGADLTTDIKPVDIKGGHELGLAAAPFKAHGFDKDKSEDDLYRWGDGRSAYLAEHSAGGSGYFPDSSWSDGPYVYGGPGYGYYPYGYGFYGGYPYYAGLGFYGGWGYRGGWGYGGFRGWRR
jgi:hypothetical protein